MTSLVRLLLKGGSGIVVRVWASVVVMCSPENHDDYRTVLVCLLTEE